MKPTLIIVSLAFGALLGCNVHTHGTAAQVDARSSMPCPIVTPLHGLLPVLIWLGVLPRPVMASTVTAGDTSTSIVIHPDPNDQITCGKSAIETIDDVVFTTRTLANGKPLDLSMDVQMPVAPGENPWWCTLRAEDLYIQAPKGGPHSIYAPTLPKPVLSSPACSISGR